MVGQAQAALVVEQGYIATKTEEVEVHLRTYIETITILRVCKLLQVLAHTELTQIHTGFETKFNAGFGRLRNAERQHYSKNQKRLFHNAVYIKVYLFRGRYNDAPPNSRRCRLSSQLKLPKRCASYTNRRRYSLSPSRQRLQQNR